MWVAHTIIPASGSLASVDGRAFLVPREPWKPFGVVMVTRERWPLGFHTPEADTMAETTTPVAHGGIFLPRGSEGRQIESCIGQPLRKTRRRNAKLSWTVCASKDPLANGADGCWKPALYPSLGIIWSRGKDQHQLCSVDMLATSCHNAVHDVFQSAMKNPPQIK